MTHVSKRVLMMPCHSRQTFERTQWSLAMRPDEPQAPDAREALIKLCVRYWYPIYAYLRRFGHGPASAQQITRGFLQHLFQHFCDSGVTMAKGRFRQYLLARLRKYMMSGGHDPSQGEVVAELIEPPDLELRNQRDNASAQSPEHAYQQSFALELLARSTARLREEASQTGRLDMYDALEPFLAIEPSPVENVELARRLGMRSLTISVALRRLRQRFREVIDAELADTVASAEELQAEQQALYAVLQGDG
jgi:RNA polymerase sigma-70 factor (ECF subfamily)